MHREKDLYVDWVDKDTGETGKYLFRKLKWDDRVPSPKNDDNIDMVVHEENMDIISEVREYKDSDKVPNPTPYDVMEIQSPWRGNILNIDLPDFRYEGIVRKVNFKPKRCGNVSIPTGYYYLRSFDYSVRLLVVCTYYKNKPFLYSFYDLENRIYLGKYSDFLMRLIDDSGEYKDFNYNGTLKSRKYPKYDSISFQDFSLSYVTSFSKIEDDESYLKRNPLANSETTYFYMLSINECSLRDKRKKWTRPLLVGGDDSFFNCEKSDKGVLSSAVLWRNNWFNSYNIFAYKDICDNNFIYCDTIDDDFRTRMVKISKYSYHVSRLKYKNFDEWSLYDVKHTDRIYDGRKFLLRLNPTKHLSNKATLVVPLDSIYYTTELKTDAGVEVVTYKYGRKEEPMLVQGTLKDVTDSGFIPDSWILKSAEQGTEDLPQLPTSTFEDKVVQRLEVTQEVQESEEKQEEVSNEQGTQEKPYVTANDDEKVLTAFKLANSMEDEEEEPSTEEEPVVGQQELVESTEPDEKVVVAEPEKEAEQVTPVEEEKSQGTSEETDVKEEKEEVPLLDLPLDTEVPPEGYQGIVEVLGVSYIDILTFCYLFDVDFDEIRYSVETQGYSLYNAILDVICYTFNLDSNEIRFSIERDDLTLEGAIAKELSYADLSHCRKGFKYNYIVYRSVLHCCKIKGFDYNAVMAYKESHDCTYEEAVCEVESSLRKSRLQEYLATHDSEENADKDNRVPQEKPDTPKDSGMLFFRGNYYDSISELCKDLGLDEYYYSMIERKKKRLKPLSVVKLFFNDKECKKFSYESVDYNNLLDCCAKLGISASVVIMAYLKNRTPFEETIGVLLKELGNGNGLPVKTVARVQPEPRKESEHEKVEPKTVESKEELKKSKEEPKEEPVPVEHKEVVTSVQPEVDTLVTPVKTIGVQVQKPVKSEVKAALEKPVEPKTEVKPFSVIQLDKLGAKVVTYYDVVYPNTVMFRGIRYSDLNELCTAMNVPLEVFDGYTSSEKIMEDRLAVYKEQERLKEVKPVSSTSDFNSFKKNTNTSHDDDYYYYGSQKFKSLRELCRQKGVPQNYIERHLPELRGSRDFTSIVKKYKRGLYEKSDTVFEYRDQKYRSFEDACAVFYITTSEVREYRAKNRYATDQQIIDALRRG